MVTLLRTMKVLMVAIMATLFSLIALDNLIDFQTNWQFVQHVLMMDTVGETAVKSRAINDVNFQLFAYYTIIFWEICIAMTLWCGTFVMAKNIKSDGIGFYHSKKWAYIGLFMIFLLFMGGFVIVGGEWFDMWRSKTWNGQKAAEIMLSFTLLISLFLKGDGSLGNE